MMPNPFAQFDQDQKDNPFAKFDAKPENTPQEAPTSDAGLSLSKALAPIGEIPGEIAKEFKGGLAESEAARKSFVPDISAGKYGAAAGDVGNYALGGLKAAISPYSGTQEALLNKPLEKTIPQDNPVGKFATQTIEDAAGFMGPGAAAKTIGEAGKVAKTLGDVPGNAARAMLKPTPAAQKLINEGVEMPIGAMKGGFLKTAEEKSTSVPITGDAIRSAYNRTIDSWNRATVNQIFKPFGKEVDKNVKPGPDLIRDANKKMDEIYGNIHKQIEFGADDAFAKEAHSILETNLGKVAEGDQTRLRSVLKERVLDELYDAKKVEAPAKYDVYGMKTADAKSETAYTPKELSGEDLQRIRSDIRTEARSFSRSQSMSERQIGYALQDANAAIGEALGRRNPTAKAALDAADKAYAGLTRIEEASAARVKGGGRFNPTDFLSSIRKMESGPRNKTFANGDALLQEWASTSQEALASVVNNSGTADRALWYDLLAGGTAYGLGGVPGIATLGATAIPWTGPVVRGMNSLVRQSPAAEIAKSVKP